MPLTHASRRTVFCVVPRDLAPELHDALREHWRDDPSIVVVVERRVTERRRLERRSTREPAPASGDRRKSPRAGERRWQERRAISGRVESPVLPPGLQSLADRLLFVARVEPASRHAEDREANRLVERVKIGDTAAFDRLYMRYFDRVYAYARVALRDPHEAEDVAQQVFANVIQALPRYEVRADAPFRAWLFRITRNAVLRALSRAGRLRPEEPTELDRRLESPTPDAPMGLAWLSDDDLAILVERLPLGQRQVILLRYVFDFTTHEIASALDRTPVAIRMLEHRAMRALESRLGTLRGTRRCDRSSMALRRRPHTVLSRRLMALLPSGPVG
jgi:RNA polymerase sigma-70 factor, ECF subfamily